MKSVELQIYRVWKTEKSTIGILSVENRFWCFTIEDKVRPKGIKIDGLTAIPYGTYEVILKKSPRTGLLTPWILKVKGFTNIQIHIACYASKVDGCIGVGLTRDGDNMVQRSKQAFTILMRYLKKADKITLTII